MGLPSESRKLPHSNINAMFRRAAVPCDFVPRKLENWAVHVLALEPILTALGLLLFVFPTGSCV